MTRYQQKKSIFAVFIIFMFIYEELSRIFCGGVIDPTFYKKPENKKVYGWKWRFFFFIFQRQFFFYRKSIKKLVNLLMKFKYETFCPNFIHFRPPKISVMNYRPNEWSSHVRNYPPNQETAKNVDHARGSLHIFFLFSIMENFNLRVMRQRD